MDKIPRYSTELIEFLDKNIGKPKFPETPQQITNLSETTIRVGCYWAGQRALVDSLVAALQEDYDANASGEAPGDTIDLGLGEVLDTNGGRRESVASTHVAARFVDPLSDDSPDESGD